MKILSKLPALLVLADGTVYKGTAIGKIGTTAGELCFNTGLTGYQEVFTDPSYYKQILISTNVHVGNYGTQNQEVESDGIKIAGLVCKSFSDVFSRHSANLSLQDYFIDNNRSDAIFVRDVSSAQRKWIYSILGDKGFDKKRLYRLKTTFSKR